MTQLIIEDLWATVGGTEVLRGVNLEVTGGQVHAVMGPNGSGKSTLAHVLMGRPNYEVTRGAITLNGQNLTHWSTYERAQAGLFLGMQSPIEIPGVKLIDMLRASYEAAGRNPATLTDDLLAEAQQVELEAALLQRAINTDLSGGERKRSEAVQLAVLQPKVAVLDEVDSGLDVDALRSISRRLERATQEPIGTGVGAGAGSSAATTTDPADGLAVLAITHYSRLFDELKPDIVSVLVKGSIVTSGGEELAHEIEAHGFEQWESPGEVGVGIRL